MGLSQAAAGPGEGGGVDGSESVIQVPPAAALLGGPGLSGARPPLDAASRVTIRCRDVHKFYLAGERSVYALKGISVDVREREFVSIVGKSGCGKSTLLHCIDLDRKSTRLNSSHSSISYAVFCLKKKKLTGPEYIVKSQPDSLSK